jgi:uncharacterized GH25 family protein
MQESKLSMMIQGHEIWLEKNRAENGNMELSLIFGHNMRQDGVGDIKRLSPLVYLPDGTKLDVTLTPGEDRHFMKFDASKDGFYTAFVDMGTTIWSQTKEGYNEGPKFEFKDVIYAGAYHQMAKTIVAAGNTGEYQSVPLHGILEIVPKEPFGRMGEAVELVVLYEDKPLALAEVKAVSKKEGKEMAVVKTDENGSARIPVSEEGEWMFLVRHLDPTKKVNQEFDESVFVNTLVLEVR